MNKNKLKVDDSKIFSIEKEFLKPLENDWNKWKETADQAIYFEDISTHKKNEIDNILFSLCELKQNYDMINYTNVERKYIHVRCDQLNLKHKSKTLNGKRILQITVTEDWTYSNYVKKIKTKKIKIKKQKTDFCEICDNEKNLEDLYMNWRGLGIYCEDCINNDHELAGLKWESVEDFA